MLKQLNRNTEMSKIDNPELLLDYGFKRYNLDYDNGTKEVVFWKKIYCESENADLYLQIEFESCMSDNSDATYIENCNYCYNRAYLKLINSDDDLENYDDIFCDEFDAEVLGKKQLYFDTFGQLLDFCKTLGIALKKDAAQKPAKQKKSTKGHKAGEKCVEKPRSEESDSLCGGLDKQGSEKTSSQTDAEKKRAEHLARAKASIEKLGKLFPDEFPMKNSTEDQGKTLASLYPGKSLAEIELEMLEGDEEGFLKALQKFNQEKKQ